VIFEVILNLIKNILFLVFGWINLPQFPSTLKNGIDTLMGSIFDNLDLVSIIIRWQTLVICIPILIILINFDKVYKLTMWILRKIPMVGIK